MWLCAREARRSGVVAHPSTSKLPMFSTGRQNTCVSKSGRGTATSNEGASVRQVKGFTRRR